MVPSVLSLSMLCCIICCCAVLCCAVLCCAVPSVPRCAVPCYVASSFNAVLFHAMLCRTLPCCSISCHTVSPIAMLQHFQTSCDFLCYGVAGYAMFCQSTQCCDVPVKLYHAVSCSAEVWASFALLPFLLFTAVPLEAMLCSCGSAATSCNAAYTLAVGHHLPAPQYTYIYCLLVQDKL